MGLKVEGSNPSIHPYLNRHLLKSPLSIPYTSKLDVLIKPFTVPRTKSPELGWLQLL